MRHTESDFISPAEVLSMFLMQTMNSDGSCQNSVNRQPVCSAHKRGVQQLKSSPSKSLELEKGSYYFLYLG